MSSSRYSTLPPRLLTAESTWLLEPGTAATISCTVLLWLARASAISARSCLPSPRSSPRADGALAVDASGSRIAAARVPAKRVAARRRLDVYMAGSPPSHTQGRVVSARLGWAGHQGRPWHRET